MRFTFRLDPAGPEIAIDRPMWWGRTRVFADGVELPRSGGRYMVPRPDGTTSELTIKSNFLDYAPIVVIDGRERPLLRRLHWYEYLIAGFPLVLIVVGGALGATFGFLALMANLRVIRTERSIAFKALVIGNITLVAFTSYLIGAFLIQVGTVR